MAFGDPINLDRVTLTSCNVPDNPSSRDRELAERYLDQPAILPQEVLERIWEVLTSSGSRTFEPRLGSWSRKLGNSGILIQDIAEDLYHIEDVNALDTSPRQLLWHSPTRSND